MTVSLKVVKLQYSLSGRICLDKEWVEEVEEITWLSKWQSYLGRCSREEVGEEEEALTEVVPVEELLQSELCVQLIFKANKSHS